jgi:hypothetical protein
MATTAEAQQGPRSWLDAFRPPAYVPLVRSNVAIVFSTVLSLAGAYACSPSDEEAGASENPCLKGFSLLNEVATELQEAPLSCSTAADCTLLPLRAECGGSQVSSCGIAVHRNVLPHFEQADVDARFCALVQGSEYGCWAGPSCAQAEIACEAARCVMRFPGAAPASP